MIETKVMPNNTDLERRVLTALMIYNDIAFDVVYKLQSKAFYNSNNMLMYQQALDLTMKGKTCDMLTMIQGLDGSIDSAYIMEIGTDYVAEDLVPQYVDTLMELQARREVISLTAQNNKAYSEANDVYELVNDIHSSLDNIGSTTDGLTKDGGDILAECLEQHEEAKNNTSEFTGVTTGYRNLNKLNNGWSEGELIILAGRPAMGKTTLALNFMLEAIKKDKKVAMFSMEMTTKELGQKMLSIMTGIETDRIKLGQCTPTELVDLQNKWQSLISDSLTVNDDGSMDIHKLKSIAKKIKASQGLDMIVVDYLQLLNGTDKAIGGGSREQQVSYLSRSLKALAKDLNIPIICLSQLSRALESREDKRPMLSDLRESGAIEQDANQVIFVYRDAYYTKAENDNITEVIVSKNRSGRCGSAKLEFNGSKSTFTEHQEAYDSMV
jgi:replicative DNA helicase